VVVGRQAEQQRIAALLEAARGGRSGALVLVGEPGAGKTSLLAWAAGEAAQDMLVARADGVQADAELPFAGLFELCRPLLAFLPELPARQARALESALALADGEPADRFSVAAATLSLLAAAAEEQPLCVLVDDGQWLDAASAHALAFAARRLEADRVAMLIAVRDTGPGDLDVSGLQRLELGGLEAEAAGELLAGSAGAPVSRGVLAELHQATHGNPLALRELARRLSPHQLAGREPLEHPLPAGPEIEATYAGRAEGLGPDARRGLLVAAISSTSALDVVLRACLSLGADPAGLEAAEDDGLVSLDGGRVRFAHPLVRSALFHAAAPSERRAAQRALADALLESGDEERYAWHLAAATLQPDEEVAARLEATARSAANRSGYASAASAYERAARLTPDPATRRERLARAAEAAFLAGRTERARSLLHDALDGPADPASRARLLHLQGRIEHLCGDSAAGAASLTAAAALVGPDEPERAVEVLADAVEAALSAGDPAGTLPLVESLRAARVETGDAGALRSLAIGAALIWNGRSSDGKAAVREGLALVDLDGPAGHEPRLLTWAAGCAQAAGELRTSIRMVEAAIAAAREQDAVGILPEALGIAATCYFYEKRWNDALAAADEAAGLARETGQAYMAWTNHSVLARLSAWRGHEEECRAHAAAADEAAEALGASWHRPWTASRVALLDLGAGRAEAAAEQYARIADELEALRASPPKLVAVLGDLCEAQVRLARLDEAAASLARAEGHAGPDPDPAERAVLARARGLLAAEDAYPACFEAALGHHAALDETETAEAFRTRLCYGERLRRARRRREARVQLRLAIEGFDALGATPWAERARVELQASGEIARRRDASTLDELTAHELKIARLVAEGASNRDVAARLYLSTKTVEYHLSRIYRKAGVTSRAELTRLLSMAA
jgi:DNA-binding CsgD family transcriptional regulator